MTHLSSCYFCGVALEDPLETYELPETDTTVTLCSSCSEKLTTIFDATGHEELAPLSDQRTAIVETTTTMSNAQALSSEDTTENANDSTESEKDDAESDDNAEADDTDSKAETPQPTSETDSESNEARDDDSTPDVDGDGAAEQQNDTDEGITDVAESEFESIDTAEESPADDPETGGENAESTDTLVDPLDTEDDPFSEDAFDEDVEIDLDNDDTNPDDDEQLADGDTLDESDTEQDAFERDDDTASQDEVDETPDSGDESDPARTTISALEYNKVMRMLQNRDFPVNRDDIEIVAANAYDLQTSECAQVIDLAVDRGLLDERDGQLYRPEES